MNAFTNKLVLPVAVKKAHLNRVYRIPCGPSLSEKLTIMSLQVSKQMHNQQPDVFFNAIFGQTL